MRAIAGKHPPEIGISTGRRSVKRAKLERLVEQTQGSEGGLVTGISGGSFTHRGLT